MYRHHRVALGLKKPCRLETVFHCDRGTDSSVDLDEPAVGNDTANRPNEDGAESRLSKLAAPPLPTQAASSSFTFEKDAECHK